MSNYRTEKCCLECRHNETELCDADDEPCRYYEGYVKGKADAECEYTSKVFEILREIDADYISIDYLIEVHEWAKEE